MKHLLILLCFNTICNAQKTFIKYQNPKNKLIDSFKIQLKYYDELLYLTYENTNTFSTYSFDGQCNTIYKKKGKIEYEVIKVTPIKDNAYPISRIKYNNGYYYTNGIGKLKHFYNNKFSNPIDLNHTKKYLLDKFSLVGYNNHIQFIYDSFFYSTFYYKSVTQYQSYYYEKAISKFKITKNNFEYIKDIITRPTSMYKFQVPYIFYAKVNSKLYYIFSCFDSLYCYDLKKDEMCGKSIINNVEFVMPQKWDYTKMINRSNDFNSYDTKYSLKNFKYESLYYNILTGHLLLYYHTPAENRKQNLKLLAMDILGNKVAYYEFNEDYFDSFNFFIIPNKGIAMPLLIKEDKLHEKPVTYHIYNF